jgi:hypothetical protein
MKGVHGFGSFVVWLQIAVAILVLVTLLLREGAEPGPGGIRQILSSKPIRIAAIGLALEGLLLVMRIVRPNGLF